ncbi:MAG: 1-acyl-sn-glycerol-3-phosphate acyltransferase [Oscillatoriaceae bacterium SKW80]|nr:1-acyl-sn-glycerol-3-phosphate acyltransferase [Oscillatoriaceae bacterium SKYG93]MCX8121177.1 1-acyl-sn-glycerol-3-phosphate acyltransferase [Oscillatoriaceae bacterium SKW80]MDW8453493.1 1-acyl-sn-glycerol-3-phosphate acyltransferase [Oscillatoriaceae cyanobacterium SKYGB_i_bin93]HIK26843.1 1-acyl-sn-glycerol-3-phosphate acyltransferase [Oscillatoriaceae cyanobacterium M7585_C2015_266]
MTNIITQAQPPLKFIPPAFNPLIWKFCQQGLPLWLKFRTNITNIQAENVSLLVELYRQFQEHKIRFLMAFRHPNTDDPYCLGDLVWRQLPRVAKQQGVSLQSPTHFHFIYDRGIPLWAGKWIGWLYSQLGGTPILRGGFDRQGLRSARELFVNGRFPLAAAPEGATNGHNEIVSPLEPGISQLAFWCVEDLLKEARSEQVFIVPIGIQYYYIEEPWDAVENLLTQLEVDSGLPPLDTNTPEFKNISEESNRQRFHILYRRLIRLGNHLLTIMENFYIQFYHQKLPHTDNIDIATRLSALLDVALRVAEQYFDLQPKGSLIDRCRRLEQAGWERIYREDIKDIEALSPLERGLADRIAEEASLRMWHMRLVESFVAVTGRYVQEKQTVERFAETTLLLSDVITRIKGGNPFQRPKLGKQRVQMIVGEPISVSDRWDAYKSSRRSAIATLTKDLQTSLESMIR